MADEIEVDSLSLRDFTNGYWFEAPGVLDLVPTVRGTDTTVPGKAGREARNRVADTLEFAIHGIVWGDGATADDARESYRSRFAALKAICSPTADPFTVTLSAPLEGLASGETAVLNARFLRFVGPPSMDAQVREFSIELECVEEPPEWVIS